MITLWMIIKSIYKLFTHIFYIFRPASWIAALGLLTDNLKKFLGIISLDVRGIIIDQKGRILLVEHRYSDGWYLPGGGVKRSESLIDAIKRELKEEVGVAVVGPIKLIGVYTRKDNVGHVIVFEIRFWSQKFQRNLEIKEFGWFELEKLPENTSPATRRRLKEYVEHQDNPIFEW